MVDVASGHKDMVDFSFMITYNCNLSCSFCMYDGGPHQTEVVSYRKTKEFVDTFNWDMINSVGFYGGEISCNMEDFNLFINLVPCGDIQKFCITNGVWRFPYGFVDFVYTNELFAFISTTPEHKKFQDTEMLNNLVETSGRFHFKEDDTKGNLLPMGRNAGLSRCSYKCLRWNKPWRYALNPYGQVIFQSCDGVYPIVGDYTEDFEEIMSRKIECKEKHNHE